MKKYTITVDWKEFWFKFILCFILCSVGIYLFDNALWEFGIGIGIGNGLGTALFAIKINRQ